MLIRMIRDEDTDLGITSQVGWWAAVCGVAESRTRLTWLSSSSSISWNHGNRRDHTEKRGRRGKNKGTKDGSRSKPTVRLGGACCVGNRKQKVKRRGTSQVVQWLRLCAVQCRGLCSISAWGTKIPRATWPKKKKLQSWKIIKTYEPRQGE